MSDAVNHPAYYNRGGVEVIAFIEDWKLDFSLGSFVKYVCRAGLKDDVVQDLKKALWYIERFRKHPRIPEEAGTIDWREYAESQGLRNELCLAMAAVQLMLQDGPELMNYYCDDVVMLINLAISEIQKAASEKKNNIEPGVLEIGSDEK